MRPVGLLAALSLLAAACSGGGSEDTLPTTVTTTAIATTTTAPAPTTTTSTIPLLENGPAIVGEGDRNETVMAVQVLLNCSGYGPLSEDGVYGPNTEGEIESFQGDSGREITGGLDDSGLADLSRACTEDRQIEFDGSATQAIGVGNVGPGDPDVWTVTGDEGDRLTVVADGVGAGLNVSVSAGDDLIGEGPLSGVWAGELPAAGEYRIAVATTGEATTYTLYVSTPDLGDRPSISASKAGSVEVDVVDDPVTSVCIDTTGDGSFVAETPGGYLAVNSGAIGTHALQLGGIGAPVEYIFKDGTPGYYGFADELEVVIGEDVSGTARTFLNDRGGHDRGFALAFDFARAVTPCGGEGTSVELRADGIGIVDFGATNVDASLLLIAEALPGTSPAQDSGWQPTDPARNDFGICRAGITETRVVVIDNLTLYFADGPTSFAAEGTRHFVAWKADAGVIPLFTPGGAGPGSTLAELVAGHPDAGLVADGGVEVFISSPPGSDAWLRAEASDAAGVDDADAVVGSFRGGRFCDIEI